MTLATIETELAALMARTSPQASALTLEQEMAALLAAAGPRTVPTFAQARAWLWTASEARRRFAAAPTREERRAFRLLADELQIAERADRAASAAAATLAA